VRTPLRILGLVVVVALGAAWAFTFRPQSLGGPAGWVMVRGVSMNPKYHTGDLVITRPRATYRKGDIVAYRVPKGDVGAGVVVIHRIIGGSARTGYVMQGDNNPRADEWRPKRRDIVGAAWVLAPQMGKMLAFLHAPVPLASLAAGIAVAMVLVPGGPSEDEREDEHDEGSGDGGADEIPVPRAWVPPLVDVGAPTRVFLGLDVWDSVGALRASDGDGSLRIELRRVELAAGLRPAMATPDREVLLTA
jgi:signal peptidase I